MMTEDLRQELISHCAIDAKLQVCQGPLAAFA